MDRRLAALAVALAAAAAAAGGCDGDDSASPVEAGDPRPDTYVPARRPPREPELDCTRPDAGDAGDREPDLSDPTTLVLRLDDLPAGFNFDVGYQEGGVGRVLLSEVGEELGAALERADADTAARGQFGKGRRAPPPVPPGAPPPPPSCPQPEIEVRVAAVAASTPAGAAAVYRVRELFAGSTTGFGEGPVNAPVRRSRPVAVGDERELLEKDFVFGLENHTLVWRQGRVVALVTVVAKDDEAALDLLARLAERQAAYISAAS